jgi:segregation and condensation protein B
MNQETLKSAIEAMLMVADEPVSVGRLTALLEKQLSEAVPRDKVRLAIDSLVSDYVGRGVELVEVSAGFRFRSNAEYSSFVGGLWEERKPRYSKAFLETLSIIAYRQPVTRGEIEHIRGVAVSSNIIRLLLERDWIKAVGHRDVPGRPVIFATTKEFLDYFGLKALDQLPALPDVTDLDATHDKFFVDDTDLCVTSTDEPDKLEAADARKRLGESTITQ